MIDKLYNKYFQKSRSFLYPALGIRKKSSFTPAGTYISLPEMIRPEDMKLICTFKKDDSENFKVFEEAMLLSNPLFERKLQNKQYNIYIFNFEIYKLDWFNFLTGKYSKLSKVLKKAIKDYYTASSSEYKFIDTYLNPEKYFEDYSKLLEIDVNTLKELGELCDIFNLDKETLKLSIKDLEVVTN